MTLKIRYIPGVCLFEDKFIEYYPLIEKHLNTKSTSEGCYVCSCGFYYSVAPCGYPTEISKCICGLDIGGTNYNLSFSFFNILIYRA